MKRLGMVFLAVWLLLMGLSALVNLSFPAYQVVMGLLAVAAGVLLLVGERKLLPVQNWGLFLLGIYLTLLGIIQVFGIRFANSSSLLALLALAAGILILIQR